MPFSPTGLGRYFATLAPARAGDPARSLSCVGGLLGPPTGDPILGETAHDDRDVARPLSDPGSTPAGSGPPSLEGTAFVSEAGRDIQVLGVLAIVVHGIGHCRSQDLGHQHRRFPVGEGKYLCSPINFLTPDEVEHLAHLVGRGTAVTENCPGTLALVRLDPGHLNAYLLVLARRGT